MKKRCNRRARPVIVPSIVQTASQFITIETIIDQIEAGELTVAVAGGEERWMYHDLQDHNDCELLPALDGWLVFISKLCAHAGVPAGIDAHNRIIKALESGEPIEAADVRKMRAECRRHQAIYNRIPRLIRASIARTCQVLFEVEKLDLTEERTDA